MYVSVMIRVKGFSIVGGFGEILFECRMTIMYFFIKFY